MKIQPNFFFKVLLLQSLLLISSPNIVEAAVKCNTGFMRAFGMKGMKNSKFTAVEMCSGVKNSCCTKEDQMVMYGNWISGKQEEKISNRYKTLAVIYESLMAQTKIVHEFAKKVEDQLRLKKFSNCKFLANRITSYRLPTVEAALKQSLEDMEVFFTNSYKGIYCSLCNADMHRFIDQKKVSLILSENMCRDMTKKTLSPMLYFHVHFAKYMNLVTKFMQSCDFRGEYELDTVMPKELIFVANEGIKKSLNECKLYRNTKQWLVYCKDICENFQIGKFNTFFEPNRIKVAKYVVYIKRLIAEYIRKEKSMPLFSVNLDTSSGSGEAGQGGQGSQGSQGQSGQSSGRLLSSGGNSSGGNQSGNKTDGNQQNGSQGGNENDQKRPKDKMLELIRAMESEKDVTTYKFDTTAPVSVIGFKSSYKSRGINLTEAGESSMFVEVVFNQIKTIVNLQRLAQTSGGSLTPEQKEMIKAESVGRVSSLLAIVFGLLLFRFK